MTQKRKVHPLWREEYRLLARLLTDKKVIRKKKMIQQLQGPADGKFWIRRAENGAPPGILLQALRVHLLNYRDMDLFNRIFKEFRSPWA